MSATRSRAPTRERLLKAAQAVIARDGYAAVSVISVAEQAHVASGTLYRHFASKDDLLVEVFRTVGAREERAMRAAAAGLAPEAGAIARLEEMLVTFARRALRNPRLAWALLAEPVAPRVDAERLAYRVRYAGTVADLLRDGVAAGEIGGLDADFTAAAIVGGCGAALVGPLGPAGEGRARPGEEAVVGSLRAFVRRAVGATDG